jgi:hypothetical protein
MEDNSSSSNNNNTKIKIFEIFTRLEVLWSFQNDNFKLVIISNLTNKTKTFIYFTI